MKVMGYCSAPPQVSGMISARQLQWWNAPDRHAQEGDLLLPTWFDGPPGPYSLFSSHIDVDFEDELEANDLSMSDISDQ